MTGPDYFTADHVGGWDGRIYTRSIPDRVDWRELTRPLPCGNDVIPAGWQWNGASSGIARHLVIFSFPKWKHPIASCRHDWRCAHAKTKEQRAFADKMFWIDVGRGGTKWEQAKGYAAVRLGAWFGLPRPKS
ncbi:MAG: hypothetical protein RBR06_06155 [Desulfuromonadaceae bacterium]|nr:hypothetical protein [Desulfuromonadaceae bacterium]